MSEHQSQTQLNTNAKLIVSLGSLFAFPWFALFFTLLGSRGVIAPLIVVAGTLSAVGLLANDPSSVWAALTVVGLSVVFTAFEATRPRPTLIGIAPLGVLAMIAIYLPAMCAYPEYFPVLFQLIRSDATLEEVRRLLVLSTLFWGLGFTGLFGLTSNIEEALRRVANLNSGPSNSIPLPFVFTGVVGYVITTAYTGLSYLSAGAMPAAFANIVATLSFAFYVALYGKCFEMFRAGRVSWPTCTWLATVLALDLISGSKGRFFTSTLLPVSMVFALAQRKVSNRAIGIVALGVVLSVFVVYPVLANYRNALSEGRTTVDDATAGLQTATRQIGDDYVDRILTPFIQSNTAEQVVAITSIVHFRVSRPPDDFVARLFGFWIPRVVWPTKPVAISGNDIGRESGRLNEGDRTTTVLMTSPADVYLHFGLSGTVLLVAAGLLFRVVERVFAGSPSTDALQAGIWVFFARVALVFIGVEYEAAITGLLQQLMLLILLVIGSRWFRPTSTVS